MPSNDIHPLPNTKEAFEAKLKVEPKWPKFTEFMAQKVEPAMGTLLDVPVFDPKKPVRAPSAATPATSSRARSLPKPPAKP